MNFLHRWESHLGMRAGWPIACDGTHGSDGLRGRGVAAICGFSYDQGKVYRVSLSFEAKLCSQLGFAPCYQSPTTVGPPLRHT
jgi:hypothetical protein